MGGKRPSARDLLAGWLATRRPERITEFVWEELRVALASVREDRLRRLLRETGLPLEPLVEGVRQDSLEEAARTLEALAREYRSALERGDARRAAECRRLVMTAKQRARWAAENPRVDPAKRTVKRELLLWMLTWLENPLLFEPWLRLRRTVTTAGAGEGGAR